MAALEEELGRIERDLAAVVSVGLRAADRASVEGIAARLRSLRLEGPAKEADKLATLVGSQAAALEQLNSFARLDQMLSLVRLRLSKPAEVTRTGAAVPTLHSLTVEPSLLQSAASSPLEYPADTGPVARYAFLVRAAAMVSDGRSLAPDGDGLPVWADLRIGALLTDAVARDESKAVDLASRALRMQNVVARRNGVRVLDRVLSKQSPVKEGVPGLTLLHQAMADRRPLVAHEAFAAWRRAQGRQPPGPTERLFGTSKGEEWTSLAERIAFVKQAKRDQYWYEETLLAGAAEAYKSKVPQDPVALDPGMYSFAGRLDKGDLSRLDRPRGEVISDLSRSVLEAGEAEARETALRLICLLEEPAFTTAVTAALRDRSGTVRSLALRALGHLGSDRVLAEAARRMGSGSLSKPSVWALGLLGDVRGFSAVWTSFSTSPNSNAPAISVPLFGELWERSLARLYASPSFLGRATMQCMLLWSFGARAGDVVLDLMVNAPDEVTAAQLARPLRIKDSSHARTDELSRTVVGSCCARFSDSSRPIEERRRCYDIAIDIARKSAKQLVDPALARLPPEVGSQLTARPKRPRPPEKEEE